MAARKTKTSLVSQGSAGMPLTFGEKMFAGAVARLVSQTVLHPVDVVRTRLQARGVAMSFKPAMFMKGMIPQSLFSMPAGAIQFVSFEAAKERLQKLFPDDKYTLPRILLAAAFGAAMAASVRIPQEVLKQRIQADVYPNILVALRETVGKEGLGSLYKGSAAMLSRDIPGNALGFMFHGQGKAMFQSHTGRPPATRENLVVAGIAGAIAAVIMTPVDVIKTRIMTGSGAPAGMMATLRAIVREEGAGTLMTGVIPRIMFLAPLAGITFSVYEAIAANIRKKKAVRADAGDEGAVAADEGADTRHRRSANRFSAVGQRTVTTFARRVSKQPIRLALSADHGVFLGDYALSHRVLFSIPLAC